jgi:hypothetical protein
MKHKAKYEGQATDNQSYPGLTKAIPKPVRELLIFNSEEFESATDKKPTLLLLADIDIDDNPRR